jgi:ABC-type transport system substrate-binding protein
MKQYLVGSIIFLLCTFGWGPLCIGEQAPAPRGELRIVDPHLANFASIVFNVFEHLLEIDKDGQLVLRLATGWQWRDNHTLDVALRQGVTFHNGEVFDAEIVKLNVEEAFKLRHLFHFAEYLRFQPGFTMEILDPYTIRFRFPEPDGMALARLTYLHIANRQFYRELGWAEKNW